jgi:hypothetical protein
VWRQAIPTAEWQADALALASDGSVAVLTDQVLARLSPTGDIVWSRALPDLERDARLVLDSEGVAYVGAGGLFAFAPDGGEVFRREERLQPVAIDCLGRLIAHRGDTLVAIV